MKLVKNLICLVLAWGCKHMSALVLINTIITILTYASALFFLVAIVRTFIKTKNVQDALVYVVMMIPFILRLLRLK